MGQVVDGIAGAGGDGVPGDRDQLRAVPAGVVEPVPQQPGHVRGDPPGRRRRCAGFPGHEDEVGCRAGRLGQRFQVGVGAEAAGQRGQRGAGRGENGVAGWGTGRCALDGSPGELVQVLGGSGGSQLSFVDRTQSECADREGRSPVRVGGLHPYGVVAVVREPDPQRAGTRRGRLEAHPRPGERQAGRAHTVAVAAEPDQGVQRGIPERRVDPEPVDRLRGVEGDLGQQLAGPAPGPPDAAEEWPVLVAGRAELLVEQCGVDRLGVGRRPRREGRRCGVLGGYEVAAGVDGPLLLVGGAGPHHDLTGRHADLQLPFLLRTERQRRVQHQLTQFGKTGLPPGVHHHVHQRRTRHQHRAEDGVPGQPRLRPQRQAAGEDDGVAVRHADPGGKQRVGRGGEAERSRVDRAAVGRVQPVPLVLEGVGG
jgi:hypothetical protein